MAFNESCVVKEQRALLLILLLFICNVYCQVRYSIPEEMAKGSVVGNIADDLGIDIKRLQSGRARIIAGDSSRYVELNADKGILSVNERIDRELLCKQTSPCSFSFEIILENPIQLYRVTVEIMDVNDHSPSFPKDEVKIEISESTHSGARFLLDNAFDPDVGINTIQGYSLRPTDNFILKHESRPDGNRYLEIMLQSPLDREKQEELLLILTAVDGGSPQKSGVMKINIKVLDANDNAPVFTRKLYRAAVPENSPNGTVVINVSATDADKGVNGDVTYAFRHIALSDNGLFKIDERSGYIFVIGHIDFEQANKYEINIEAKDRGGLTDSCALIVEIIDVNDNVPIISLTSSTNHISEDALPGTTIAVVNVKDLDSGQNGQVNCFINKNSPFVIKSSLTNYYTLLTEEKLDRELVSEYNITITATDEGSPALSSNKTIYLKVSDVNDNAPIFEQRSYAATVVENNSPGVSVFTVRALDADCCQNARVTYLLEGTEINGAPASSIVSINSESGVIYAVRSFDYENIRSFKINIRAQDGGSPPMSSNATVNIFIQDQNDNAPQILYPVQTSASLVAEMVPRSADVGYLVTKVVAVDVDSGQNAWLSYKLLKQADRALFEVGLQNGEIRTLRQVTDKDPVKQRLTVVVEDNGQPSRSATVNVNVAVADNFPEVLSEFTDLTHDKNYNDNLTFYLVLALAVVCFLFVSSLVVIISVKVYRWRQSRTFYQSNLPVIPYYPPRYADAGDTGTLQHLYNYEVCRTTDSRHSDIKYLRPMSQSLVSVDASGTETMPHAHKERAQLETEDSSKEQKPPNTDWRFSQNQRPGTSGQHKYNTTQIRWTPYGKARAAPPPEAAVGTGPWPNPPTEAEQLQALMAAANEVSEATATLGPGTMGLSTRYSPQFTLQHVPDYRQNVYIPGSTATLTANQQQQQQQQQQPPQPALPQPPPQAEAPKAAQTPASKKKSAKKDKK
ncbi:protocadherin gamma-A11-like isoform X30 [Anguilla anguilla]|uniref:protocadherin gamma-A11-like isoform X30 n=1 Tax=Anguilla anguilla TaxID=7936 RepID=UPI0015AEDF77|nr:protocadherin gamma-A11-like isoform X30 [Anguilla anguilla]